MSSANPATKLFLIALEEGSDFEKHLTYCLAQGQKDGLQGLIHQSSSVTDSLLLGVDEVADDFEETVISTGIGIGG